MLPTLGIVTPYFQKKPGLLARALRSVASQTADLIFRHVIVDDGSPIGTQSECAEVPPGRVERTVLRQVNTGPSAARNRALQFLAKTRPRPDFIAFLDSDDYWLNSHISVALKALSSGREFYFSNRRIEWASSTGEKWRTDKFWPPSVLISTDLMRFEGEFLRLVLSSLVHTSGVVYRFEPFVTARFDERLRAAEDYLFFLAVMTQAKGVVYGRHPNTCAGRGLNISHIDWSTPDSLAQNNDIRTMLDAALTRFRLSDSDRWFARDKLKRLDRGTAATLWRMIRLGQLSIAIRGIMRRPAILRSMLEILIQKRKR